jgi:Delta7-sterol 5-desaturase
VNQLALVWTQMLAFDGGRYLVAAGGAFLAFWVWGRRRFRHRRLYRAAPPPDQLRREAAYSAATVLIFAAVGTGLWFGSRAGVFRIYTRVADRGWAYFAFTVALLIVAHDTYFYWAHRAMHHRRLYRRVHHVHHMSRSPSPWAAYAFAPAEALVHAAFVPLAVAVVPVHQIALFLFLTFMIARNVLGHLGLELFPAGFVHRRRWRWSTSTTHHALHHRRPHGNYGLYFTWWDRAMGTTDPTYEATFDEVTARPRDRDGQPIAARTWR